MITNDYFKIQKLVLETQSAQKAQSKEPNRYIHRDNEDKPICLSSSSPQWLCGNMLAMDD